MKFENRLTKALAGDEKSLEYMMRWISPTNWRVSIIEVSEQKINQIITACDPVIVENPKAANAIFLRALVFQYWNKDFVTAKRLYEQASKLDHILATSRLAYLSALGLGCKLDHGHAINLCEKGIHANDGESLYVAGFIYEQKKDYATAIKYYDKAITRDHASAMFIRASFHAEGIGGPIDINAAIKLYEEAIELNHTSAMIYRAKIHLSGDANVDPDPIAGVKLLRRALKDKYNNKEALKLLENTASAIHTAVAYHAAIGLYQFNNSKPLESFIKSHQHEFLLLLRNDSLTSISQKVAHIDFMRRLLPVKNINLVDIPSYKIMCECYIDAAQRKFKRNKFDKALELYAKVPASPSLVEINGQVYLAMASCIYEKALAEKNPAFAAFEIAKPYLEKGIELKNADCEKKYKTIIQDIVENKHLTDLVDCQKAYEEYKAKLPTAQLALEVFISKHHLRDPDYWHQQLVNGEGVELEHAAQKITVPSGYSELFSIIKDNNSDAKEKAKAISSKVNTWVNFFSTMKTKLLNSNDKLLQCYTDAKKLSM